MTPTARPPRSWWPDPPLKAADMGPPATPLTAAAANVVNNPRYTGPPHYTGPLV